MKTLGIILGWALLPVFCICVALPVSDVRRQEKTTFKEVDADETALLRLVEPYQYCLAFCCIDTIDAKMGLFRKKFNLVFKDKSKFNGAFISSNDYLFRKDIKAYSLDLDHVDGTSTSLDEKELHEQFPLLAKRLDYLVKRMKIKKFDPNEECHFKL